MLGHEQQTVRMALTAALHHSAGPREKVEMQQNGAPRGQKTAARAREVEEQATHDGLRARMAPPLGVRPGSLAEPGPQRSDRSLRRSSGQTPLLGVPSLADAPPEAIDGRTLRYLLKANLARKKYEEEEEEEEEKKYQERAAETRRRAQALLDHAVSLPKRKRKKKRKKKLPRSGYKFLPRFRRLFGTNSTLFLREGGPWLLRSILAASCPYGSLLAQDARHLGRYGPEGHLCRDTEFASVARAVRTWKPGLSTSHWYLAVTCSVLVLPAECCGGFFWEITSGFLPVIGAIWFDSGYMCLSVYGDLGLAGCDAPRAVFLRGCVRP